MIQINLLPESERKGKKGAGAGAGIPTMPSGPSSFAPNLAIAALALVMFGGVGGLGYHSWSNVHEAKLRYEELRQEKAGLDAGIAELSEDAQEIRRLRAVFANQWEVLQSLDPPRRVLWSQKLNMLAALVPNDIFLTELNLDETVREIEIDSSIRAREIWAEDGKKGDEPEKVSKPIITQTLTLQGFATGRTNAEQIGNIIEFGQVLGSHEATDADGETTRFIDNFDPEIAYGAFEATVYEGVSAQEFTLKLTTVPAEPEPMVFPTAPATDPSGEIAQATAEEPAA